MRFTRVTHSVWLQPARHASLGSLFRKQLPAEWLPQAAPVQTKIPCDRYDRQSPGHMTVLQLQGRQGKLVLKVSSLGRRHSQCGKFPELRKNSKKVMESLT